MLREARQRRWSGPKVDLYGAVSSDGRYLSYVNWETGDLALHDIVADTDRLLTNAPPWTSGSEYAEESAISRDGKQVAYAWYNTKRRFELRIVNLQTSGFPAPQQLFDSEDVSRIAPYDWSPDGKWLAVGLQRNDGTAQIGLVSPQEGSLRVLKSVVAIPTRMFFSPDGKYLGLDLPAGDMPDRDILVLTVGDAGETKAVTGPSQDIMMGWSPDGKRLLFASDRSGSMGLWAIPMADGKPQGPLEFVRPNIDPKSLGVTASGALYLGATIDDRDIHLASLDFNTGKLLSPPVRPIQTLTGSNSQPEWSRDGKYMAYVRTKRASEPGRAGGNRVLAIRSVETGQVRELQPNLSMIFLPSWAPDGRAFVFEGTDFQGREGIYRIDAETGEAAPIAVSPPEGRFRMPQWSPDGKKIYYTVTPYRDAALIERDLASGSERRLIPRANLLYLSLSPDGRFVSGASFDSSGKSSSLLLIPIDGGEPRELLRVTAPQRFWPMVAWMPDGQGVVVRKLLFDSENAAEELLLVPVGGGQPRKLEIDTRYLNVSRINIHPDGRQVAYLGGDKKNEVWVLENFLPVAKAAPAAK
ncbi:MAG: hypothetical protein LAQ30_24530 [Acidobacteriia bacterium]|nr:hypothetical protein [Terriglobia bacterium]